MARPWLLPVCCLSSVSLRMIPTFLWVSQPTQPTATENTKQREGSVLIIPMSPPPFISYSPHSLERRGMNTEHVWPESSVMWSPIVSRAEERRGPWERFRVSDVLSLYHWSLPAPHNYLHCYWWWHLSLPLTKQTTVPRLASHGH